MVEATRPTNESGTVGGHGVDHHAAGTAAAERFHQGGGQGSHEVGVDAQGFYAPGDAGDEEVHGARGAEHGDGHQYGHQVGYDGDGGLETLFGTFDKGVVDVYLFAVCRPPEIR